MYMRDEATEESPRALQPNQEILQSNLSDFHRNALPLNAQGPCKYSGK